MNPTLLNLIDAGQGAFFQHRAPGPRLHIFQADVCGPTRRMAWDGLQFFLLPPWAWAAFLADDMGLGKDQCRTLGSFLVIEKQQDSPAQALR